MATELDRTLDEILKRRSRASRIAKKKSGKSAVALKDTARAAASAKSRSASVAANLDGTSKIIVSNLPSDITDHQVRDYFSRTVAPAKSVMLAYDRNGRSLGTATIVFKAPRAAEMAFKAFNGRQIDGKRKLKVEVVAAEGNPLDKRIAVPAFAVAQAAKTAKSTKKATKKHKSKAQSKAKSENRPLKSVEELDAEMEDYFGDQ
jgi:THO complex subunit 4